jgi:hypothetical protein
MHSLSLHEPMQRIARIRQLKLVLMPFSVLLLSKLDVGVRIVASKCAPGGSIDATCSRFTTLESQPTLSA